MPQASPMNWMFLSVMILFSSLIIFTFISIPNKTNKQIKKMSHYKYSMKW